MFNFEKLIFTVFFLLIFCCSPVVFTGDVFANQEDDYKDLEIFTDVLSLVRSSYVEDVDMEKLIYGALRGMLNTLDPHSSFLTPELYEEIQADAHGEFGGLGGDCEIAGDGEAETGAGCTAVDRHDHRRIHTVDACYGGVERSGNLSQADGDRITHIGEGGQVATGAKHRALAGDNNGADVVVFPEREHRLE